VRTEDHPLSYGDFEGIIPKGEYGGGTVMLWDRGTWAPVKGHSPELSDGKLHFLLEGERMKGEWLLVRMRAKKGEKRENWLLRKIEDRYAGNSDDLTGRHLTSIKTGRTMSAIAAEDEAPSTPLKPESMAESTSNSESGSRSGSEPDSRHKAATRRSTVGTLPAFQSPQLATLADAVPDGSNWLHEIKYDGYRCLLAVAGTRAKIYTRSGKDWTSKFPDIADAAAALGLSSALIDGEIVKPDKNGNSDFSALQRALKNREQGFTLFAFDLLEMDQHSLMDLPTIERKARLAALIPPGNTIIRYADHLIGAGEKLFQTLCEAGQEGIICKRADAPYRQTRSRSWLKIKCTHRQEFVVIGWRRSNSKGRPFASILVAQYEEDTLTYKGRVGTGFSKDDMQELADRFKRLARKTPATLVPKAEARDAHWIKPALVAEIAFTEFTADGRIRHGSYLGLRPDKSAREVQPERAMPLQQAANLEPQIRISSRDRIIFPNARATKGDLADYYQAIAPLMLPWITRRPVSLVRCPQGRDKHCFFQKHHAGSFGEHVKGVPITEKDGGIEDYLYLDDAPGVLACVQMGTIEFHGWGSRVDSLETPDRMVFDLDPDEGMDFARVRTATTDIRRHLSDIGLISFALLSGGKGVHVVVPLTPAADWPLIKDFARRFATALAQAQPERFTASLSKQKRKGRIFIDWLRNQRGSTSVLPYSARARQGAPVAAPVSWDELRSLKTPARFTIRDTAMLMQRAASSDLQHWGIANQVLPDL
jgi:bifunctional non-homologous end joining protein LigD